MGPRTACGPLALPWREVLERNDVSSIPIRERGGWSATLAFPRGSLVIDASKVLFGRWRAQPSDVLGAKIKADGVHQGEQQTSVVLCYQQPAKRGADTEPMLPLETHEIVLYQLARDSHQRAVPLADQEQAVHQINCVLEAINGTGTVTTRNDCHVASDGFSSTKPPCLEWAEYSAPNQLKNTMAVGRRWQETPVLPLAVSRLSFATEGSDLVVTCRPRQCSWKQVASVVVLLLAIAFNALLAIAKFSLRDGSLEGDGFVCRGTFSVLFIALYLVYVLILLLQLVGLPLQTATLRVSGTGWTLITESFLSCLWRLGSRESTLASAKVEVLGAKVVAPHFWQNAASAPLPLSASRVSLGIYTELQTASGAVPLEPLLGERLHVDAGFLHQERETLAATINRHLEATGAGSVAVQNDVHASVFADLTKLAAADSQERCKHTVFSTPVSLMDQQCMAIRQRNFKHGDCWVSSVPPSSVWLQQHQAADYPKHLALHPIDARVSLVHAFSNGGSDAERQGQELAYAALCCTSYPTVLVTLICWVVGVCVIVHGGLGEAFNLAFSLNLCMVLSMVWIASIVGALLLFLHLVSVKRYATVHVTDTHWRVRWLGVWIPFSWGSLWLMKPLEELLVLWSRTVAEGTIDELRGVEVRVSPVRVHFAGPGLQASLMLHYKPSNACKTRQLPIAGWGSVEHINLREKLLVAQEINGALAMLDRRFKPPMGAQAVGV